MKKNIYIACLVVVLAGYFSFASALTKPSGDADIDSLSYVFYLYYDNGQLFADRDYEIKFDVVSEKYVDVPTSPNNYKGSVINFKSESAKTFEFDPKQGNISFNSGKVQVKAPYVPDAQQVTFYDVQAKPILNVFVNAASICNDDGICTSAEGENDKTCVNDCKQTRVTPTSQPIPSLDEGLDLNTILIYSVGGLGVALGAWFGWRWWKKKRGESFLPPPSMSGSGPSSQFTEPPLPPPPIG